MNRLLRFLLSVAFIVAAGASLAAAPAGESKGPPPARQIPGLTSPDQFPRGCVDCHVVLPDKKMDVRLSTLMAQWQEKVEPALLERVRAFTPKDIALKGKHPKVPVAGADVPKTCLACHARTSKTAPPLAPLLHGIHLVGGEKNNFLTLFQGECTHCHKLDTASGNWVLKSGAEAK